MAGRPRILVDTGPLVALLRSEEMFHQWTVAQFKELPAPFVTCEPVLTETGFLVANYVNGVARFFDLLASGLLEVNFSVMAERGALQKLAIKYRDLPMSLADACLVRMAEQLEGSRVLTLNAHFRVYRKNGRQAIPLVMPDATGEAGFPPG